ncbi:MAG: serine hydrolase [Thermomicrobiales bacterium]
MKQTRGAAIRNRRSVSRLWFSLMLVLALVACGSSSAPSPAPDDPTPAPRDATATADLPQPTPALVPTPSPTTLTPEEFDTAVSQLVAKFGSRGISMVGIVITDSATGDLVTLNEDHPFVAASLYKLFVLWQTQRMIRAGQLSDDTALVLGPDTDDSEEDGYSLGDYGSTITVAEARRLMITESNNTAAWLLAKEIDWDAARPVLRDAGFAVTEVWPNPVTTPREVTRYLQGVINHNLDPALQDADYTLMLNLLKEQQINTMLSPGWPRGVVFAHKTGEVDGDTHDAGALLLPDGQVIYITVMTEGDYDPALLFMRQLATLVWARFSSSQP